MRSVFNRGDVSRMWNGLPLSEVGLKMIEIYVVSFAASAVFTSLFVLGIVKQTYMGCLFCSAMCVLVNIIWLAYRIRRTMNSGHSINECKSLYLKVFVPHAILNMIMAFFELEPIYTWLFLAYKLFGFGLLPRVVSAFIVNVVMFITYYYLPDVPQWFRRAGRRQIKRNLNIRKVRKGGRSAGGRSSMTHRTIKFR